MPILPFKRQSKSKYIDNTVPQMMRIIVTKEIEKADYNFLFGVIVIISPFTANQFFMTLCRIAIYQSYSVLH